jgi:nicotinate-nucleotide pyrophosphorylase (carboxylating)
MDASPKAVTLDWAAPELTALIRAALDEDIGSGDITCAATVPPQAIAHARLIAKQELVLAGLPVAERVFRALDPGVRFAAKQSDGVLVPAGEVVAEIEGRAAAILTAERTALNFLAHLSGIATLTRRFVEAIAGTRARIRDTRKTTPLLRRLEKYAVAVGGGSNHRLGLYDAFLIKENHIAIAGGVAEAVRRARHHAARRAGEPPEMAAYQSFRPATIAVQVEVRNAAELREALQAEAESVLLDNLSPPEAARLIEIARRERPACVIEISGGVKLSNVRAYAEAGADFISAGALTHSAAAADLSLLVEPRRVE